MLGHLVKTGIKLLFFSDKISMLLYSTRLPRLSLDVENRTLLLLVNRLLLVLRSNDERLELHGIGCLLLKLVHKVAHAGTCRVD